MDIFSLHGKVALVTGATGYLGKSMALGLCAAGAHVFVNSRNDREANDLCSILQRKGLHATAAVFDIKDEDQIKRFFEHKFAGNLDILVNNAYSGGGGTIEVCEGTDYMDSYDVTVVAAHRLIKHSLSNLRMAAKSNGYASIINISSMYGVVSPNLRIYDSSYESNPPYYGAAKAALIQWTRYASCEFGREGIRVNSISPGAFPSQEVQSSKAQLVERINEKIPMGRIGRTEEIIGPLVFLASSASSYVNGANLVVDGGWTSW